MRRPRSSPGETREPPVRNARTKRDRARSLSKAPAILALVGPLQILACAGALLARAPASREAVRGDFACEDAGIVITGSSRARTDIDPKRLAEALLVPERNVLAATVHGSNAPVWYAVLKNGIFARGCTPELVIVYDIADKLLAADVLPDERVRLLAPFLTGDDPVIERRIFQRAGRGWWTRGRERVTALRQAWMDTLTAWATGVMFASDGRETATQRGRRILDTLFDGVFGGEKLRDTAGQDAAPVIPAGIPAVERRSVLAGKPEETFLPDIIELARARGALVLVARAPSPPSRRGAERADDRLIRVTAALIERLGGAYVDLRSADVRDAWYADVRHMNALGRRQNTLALAAHVRRLGLLASRGPAGSSRAVAPAEGLRGGAGPGIDLLDAAVEVEGTPPRLPRSVDIQAVNRTVAAFLVPGYRFVADDACEPHGLLACCSPLRVAENGVPLPFPNSPAGEVMRLGRGRYAHVGERVLFTSPDGSDPTRNGRTYTLFWEPARRCGSTWLLPGERLRFMRPWPANTGELEVWKRLEFWARNFSDTAQPVRVRLVCGERTHLDATIPWADMASEPAALPVEPLDATHCPDLVLEVSGAAGSGPCAITWARLGS